MNATVIVPTFNRSDYIADSIRSILDQTVKPAQIIVVNDGSTDGTRESIQPFRDRITYLEKENGGKPSAINAALPLVKGAYIWVFDDDDVACPDALARHVEALEGNPQAGFTFSGAYYAIEDPEGRQLHVERELKPREFPWTDFLAELLLESYTASPAVVVRREVQESAGPYNPTLTRSQDWEMAIRWGLLAPAVRLPDDRPTYYRRFHPGERGKVGQRFSDRDRVTRGRAFSREILRGLEGRVRLQHYLPYTEWEEVLDGHRRRRALCRRTSVYLRKGMWPEAFADLDELAGIGFADAQLTEDERRFLIRGLAHPDALWELRNEERVGELRKRIVRPELRALQRVLVRGLYYEVRNQLSQRHWKSALKEAAIIGRLLDARDMFEQLIRS